MGTPDATGTPLLTSTRVDVVQRALDAAERTRSLNLFTSVDADAALREADAADRRYRDAATGPLDGLAYAVKDILDVAGTAVSAGTPALRHSIVGQDAPAIRRLRHAGAQLVGRTNMHELSFGITSNNAEFGPVRNPHGPDRIAGGSSGGSGAAVAAGVVPFAVAADTGGSSRIPAALCGVVGFRPTSGRYPSEGVVPISTTRDTLGVMARTVAEIATVDAVLAARPRTITGHDDLAGIVLGQPVGMAPGDYDAAVWATYHSALGVLRAAGAEIVAVEVMPLFDGTLDAGTAIAIHELPSALAAYLSRSHPGTSVEDVGRLISSPDVRRVWAVAVGGGVDRFAYADGLATRARVRARYDDVFRESRLDALIFPTTPVTARPVGEDDTITVNGRRVPTFETYTRFTNLASIVGAPGISLPVGHDADGMPIGIELDGTPGEDARLLRLASAVESALHPGA